MDVQFLCRARSLSSCSSCGEIFPEIHEEYTELLWSSGSVLSSGIFSAALSKDRVPGIGENSASLGFPPEEWTNLMVSLTESMLWPGRPSKMYVSQSAPE